MIIRVIAPAIISFLLFPISVCAQNSNLLMEYYAGSGGSMGNSGIAANQGNRSFDLNPAVMSDFSGLAISVSQKFKYYKYDLVRFSSEVGSIDWRWDNSKATLEHAAVIYPVNDKFTIGAGIFLKLDPQLVNKKRAVTFSDLFFQETRGYLYAAVVSGGYKITDDLSIGLSIYKYLGNIDCRVTGDNHGRDLAKWAYLESKMSGLNFRSGILLKKENWSTGLVVETPFKMNISAQKESSQEGTFKSLLPNYNDTEWNLPWVIGAGFSYYGVKNWLFEIDVEHRHFKSSSVQLNLYEFGGEPAWESSNIIRAGVQYYPFENIPIPIKAGYAYIPQQYYSNNSTGFSNTITGYTNIERNIRHLFNLGTSLVYDYITLDFAMEYSIVKWQRILSAPQTINDDYSERDYCFSTGLTFNL